MYSEFLLVKLINPNLGLKLKNIENKSRLKNPIVSLEEVSERTYLIELSLSDKAFQWKETWSDKFKFYGEVVLEDALYECASELPSNCSSLELKKDGRGSFVVISEEGGLVKVKNDPLSLSPVYLYQDDDVFVCGNAPLVMESFLLEMGRDVTRSAQLSAYEVLLGTPMFEKKSWDEFSLLPFDKEVLLSAKGKSIKAFFGNKLFYDPSESYTELVQKGVRELACNIKALASADKKYKVVDLTGKMDSRCILAAILNQELGDEFLFHTNGGYPLPDANVAYSIMNQFGLTAIKVEGARKGCLTTDPLKEIAFFVHSSQGMRVVYDRALESHCVQPSLIKVGGALGGGFKMSRSSSCPADIEKKDFIESLISKGDMRVSASFKKKVRDELNAYYDSCIEEGFSPPSIYDRIMIDYRNRYFNSIGECSNHPVRPKFHALYSVSLVKACMALSDAEKVSGKIHYDVIKKLFPPLLDVPFADKQWAKELSENSPQPITVASEKLYVEPARERLDLLNGNGEEAVVAIPSERKKWVALQKSLGKNWMWQNLDILHPVFKESYQKNRALLEIFFDKNSLERLSSVDYKKIRRNSDARALVGLIFIVSFILRGEKKCMVSH